MLFLIDRQPDAHLGRSAVIVDRAFLSQKYGFGRMVWLCGLSAGIEQVMPTQMPLEVNALYPVFF